MTVDCADRARPVTFCRVRGWLPSFEGLEMTSEGRDWDGGDGGPN